MSSSPAAKLFTDDTQFNAWADTQTRAGLAPFLKPGTDGPHVDVIYNYTWTLSDPKNRTETPFAVLTEYRNTRSQFENAATYYAVGQNQFFNPQDYFGDPGQEPPLRDPYMAGYLGLFDYSKPTGFWYTLPYFSEISTEITNSYATLDILEQLKSILPGSVAGIAADLFAFYSLTELETKYPRVGLMDRPKIWESSNPRQINIRFPLYNTKNEEDIIKNWELCYLLTYQNSFNKRDFITGIPPVFYTVYIPGQYFSIAAYVSDIRIYNRGNIHYMSVNGKFRNIPDVYEIDMTLTDFVMPSQNMQNILRDELPVSSEALQNLPPLTTTLDELRDLVQGP